MRLCASLVSAVLLLGPGVARAEGPPTPPPSSSFVALAPGAAWTAPLPKPDGSSPGGGLCLDSEGWTYVVETRRWYESKATAGEKVAEERGIKGFVAGLALGLLAAGITVAATR
jgi:hypothetical protein